MANTEVAPTPAGLGASGRAAKARPREGLAMRRPVELAAVLVVLAVGCLAAGRAADPPPTPPPFDFGFPPGALARLGPVKLRHESGISGFDLAPDGRTVVTGDWRGAIGAGANVRLWDAATGALRLALNTGTPYAVAFAPDGGRVAVVGSGGAAYWDTTTGTRLWQHDYAWNDSPFAVTVSPNGKLVAVGANHLTVLDAATGAAVRTIARRDRSNLTQAVVFSPDGKLIAAEDRHELRLWEVATGAPVVAFEGDAYVNGLAFGPGGKLLLAACHDGAGVWDTATGKRLRTLVTGQTAAVAISPDGTLAATAGGESPGASDRRGDSDRDIRLWNLADGELVRTIPGHAQAACALRFTPDGKTLAVAGAVVRFFDAATGKQVRKQAGHEDAISDLRFTGDGELVTAGPDGTARAWNPRTGEQRREVPLGAGRDVILSPDGKRACAVGAGGAVVTDTSTGAELGRMAVPVGAVVQFTPACDGLAACDEETLARLTFGRPPVATKLPPGPARLGGLDPTGMLGWAVEPVGGRRLVTSSIGPTPPADLIVWELATGKERWRARLAGGGGLARPVWARGGKSFAIDDEEIAAYDAATGKKLADLAGPEGRHSGVEWSPDGQHIALARHKCVECWDVTTRELAFRLALGGTTLGRMRFSPDGKLLAASTGTTAVVWEVPPPAPKLEAPQAPSPVP